MLGLGLLGLHELGESGLRWLAFDLVWAVAGGLAVGGVLGTVIARFVVYVRKRHGHAVATGELLHIGLIALAYGAALALETYGFLAVFAAGLAVRTVERGDTGEEIDEDLLRSLPVATEEAQTADETAAASVAQSLQHSNEALERIAEVALVILVGAMLSLIGIPVAIAWLAPLLFLVLRPLAVFLGLVGESMSRPQKLVIAWFGIRGIGSVYYLSFAITHGLDPELAAMLASLTLALVAASVVVHGVSVTPLMQRYERRLQKHPSEAP
jgi:NhaP-type Na+/H+ or K+/H+ antiporter